MCNIYIMWSTYCSSGQDTCFTIITYGYIRRPLLQSLHIHVLSIRLSQRMSTCVDGMLTAEFTQIIVIYIHPSWTLTDIFATKNNAAYLIIFSIWPWKSNVKVITYISPWLILFIIQTWVASPYVIRVTIFFPYIYICIYIYIISPWIKWPPFRRRHLQKQFREW